MSNLTQQEFLLKAQSQFNELLESIVQQCEDSVRVDLAVSHAVLSGFVVGAGDGNEGPRVDVDVDGKTLHRSDEPCCRSRHSELFCPSSRH